MKHIVPPEVLRIKITGKAGDGIMTAGEILMRAAALWGCSVTLTKRFPSSIRGGYAESLVTIATRTDFSPYGRCDIHFVIDCETWLPGDADLTENATILIEEDLLSCDDLIGHLRNIAQRDRTLHTIPVLRISRDCVHTEAVKSSIAAAVVCAMAGIEHESVRSVIERRFGMRESLCELNLSAAAAAYMYVKEAQELPRIELPRKVDRGIDERTMVLEGNQAVALGAIAAGCGFFASYPITPATTIAETLSELLPLWGGVTFQAEDEIAALGTAIGASFNGTKAMTATSGPGLSLMQEFIGYSSMAQIPVVVVDVQRCGPSTGMPTTHSQDDLLAAAFGGHGEGERIIIAPTTVEECFHATVQAFNCSERYRCPAILLSDTTLGKMQATVKSCALKNPLVINRRILSDETDGCTESGDYSGETGVRPMAIPGVSKTTWRATGLEHDEMSRPVSTPSERLRLSGLRRDKLRNIETEFPDAVIWDNTITGTTDETLFDAGLCAWGITASAVREAAAELRKLGYHIVCIYPRLLYPLCVDAITRWHRSCRNTIVIETNGTGQFGSLMAMGTGIKPYSITRSDGVPFTPAEIVDRVITVLRSPDHHPEKGR